MSETYEPFDPDFLKVLMNEVAGDLFESYFRPVLLGAHKLPKHTGAVLAPNHSGNAFPYDAIVLDAKLWERDGYDPKLKTRGLFEKELAVTWWMRPFGIDNFWRRGGGIDLTFDNFERLLKRGERLLYFPEGVPGIGKGFNNRYQLQPFSTSFVILAARNKVPVFPVYAINCEWIIPFNYTFKLIDWFVFKIFGVPFLPLPAAPLGLIFPFFWYSACPVRMVFVIGDAIDMEAVAKKHGVNDLQTPDRAKVKAASEEIRQDMQKELNRYVKKYGKKPYHLRSLKKKMGNLRSFFRCWPLAWPIAFVQHERNLKRPAPSNRLIAWLRDWDLIGFYLPFGWILLALTRRLRKPPYGYRGLDKKTAKTQAGEFLWKLDKRPLPPK